MSGGAIMISDMFNNVLKARVDALRNELSALVATNMELPLRAPSSRKVKESRRN